MNHVDNNLMHQRGLTLVELLVAMLLGLVLMTGMIQLFIGNKQSYQLTEEVGRMQESARYAMYLLERDIRMAGFLGCTARDRTNLVIQNHVNSSPAEFTPENGIEGWEANGTGFGSYNLLSNGASVTDADSGNWLTSGGANLDDDTNSVPGSDVIRLWHVDGDGMLATVNTATGVVSTAANPPYDQKDVMMLTDCTNVDIAMVCNDPSGGGAETAACNSNTLVNTTGSNGAHAFKLAGWVYFVGKRGDDADNPPALFRREISAGGVAGAAQEMVEGVESIQFLYGEDTDTSDPDGVANRYVTANNVSDWMNVVSVRVHLLMQSVRDDLVEGTSSFDFNGVDDVTANDGRLRYPFVATVALRNRSQ